MERHRLLLWRHVRCARTVVMALSESWGADGTRSILVFFKWPITGILIEFVGFIGLFGYVHPLVPLWKL